MKDAIEIENLVKIYNKKIYALKGINLKIDKGVFGLVGPNGAGKTTLMRIMTGILKPTKGRVSIFGFDSWKNRDKITKFIGYLPQEFGFYPELTVYEILDYIAILRRVSDSKRRKKLIENSLEVVGLSDKSKLKIKALSGGMKQRLGLAQAILCEPEILIIDEPTAGLDPQERVNFRIKLSEMSKNSMIILSTHIIEDISLTATRMAILLNGEIKFLGKPEELIYEAKDRVFNIKINKEDYEIYKNKYEILSFKDEGNKINLKIIAEKPLDFFTPVEPTLEDAYIFFLKKENEKNNNFINH
ncbi:MAG: ABC transporter ATP-binding protein [Caldisericia bacterium]|nr:ABC transporter ATP-binding protein [Caldisericia bacterium]